ncbi:cytochrome c oxidase assembly protein [Cryptosporangium aurantiacum]|uniref:Putative copper resistance protein D n=1 Tax=Cryptosporangium aurantiacum TaxID=134849 RepID=A0A1M7RB80_9ACTN|nr:cytochrome c oxidase assembly protein [Cryptosporangium aurantiacum]SHN43575.1 putative copper resistance protein D [Cryptosporangium aurantiacum]
MGHATPRTTPPPGFTLPPDRAARLVAAAAVAAAVVTTALALGYGDGVGRSVDPGLPSPGALTSWGLPLSQLIGLLAASLVVGNLVAAVFWAPRSAVARSAVAPSAVAREGSPVVGIHRRVALRAAAVWAVAAAAAWLFTLSDLRGLPVTGILTADALGNVGLRTPDGQAGLLTVVAALAAAALCRRFGVAALIVAVIGIVPPAFVGPAVSTADHRTAVASALLSLVALTLWTGGLAAVLTRAVHDRETLHAVATRYGRAALLCLIAAAATAALSAYLVLAPSGTGLSSAYGQLVAVQLVVLAALAGVGHWRRTQTVPALGRDRRDPFVRFAVLELLLLGAAVGLSVALARTPAPLDAGDATVHHESAGQQMLGYDLPPVVSLWQLAADWRPDLLVLTLCAVAVAGYLRLEQRAHRAGTPWPFRRSAAWLAGVAVVAVATSSGVARYAPAFFSVTVIQHVLLGIVAPLLLVWGAPLTLALRVLRPGTGPVTGPGDRLPAALRSRPVRVLTTPVAVAGLWSAALFGTYFTGVFEESRWSYAVDLAVSGALLGTGYLLFWWLAGPDPRPSGRRTNRARIAVAVCAGGAAVTAGLLLIHGSRLVAADWYIGLLRVLALPWPWGSTSAGADQVVGGTVLWVTSAVVFAALVADRLAATLTGRRRQKSTGTDTSRAR